MLLHWELLHPRMTKEHLGLIPAWLTTNDPRPAREQIDGWYQHGGGWNPFDGFKMNALYHLIYPDDPPLVPLAKAQLRNETILFYRHSWVAIVQHDGTFEVARID